MTTPNKLNEFNHAEGPAQRLLDRLGYPIYRKFPALEGHHD